jgi:O-methyltransferase involved in polyketide biosynthesis
MNRYSKVFAVTTFHWTEPTFFSWLGVTVYLKEAAIDAALKSMATYPSGSEVVLTFKQPIVKTGRKSSRSGSKIG